VWARLGPSSAGDNRQIEKVAVYICIIARNASRLGACTVYGCAHKLCLAQVFDQGGGVWDQKTFVVHHCRIYRDGYLPPLEVSRTTSSLFYGV
jgi:hypothetical protein